jgi:hypothetical protein
MVGAGGWDPPDAIWTQRRVSGIQERRDEVLNSRALLFRVLAGDPAFLEAPAVIAADYELERFFIASFQYHDGPDLVEELEAGTELVLIYEKGQSTRSAGRGLSFRAFSSGLHSASAQSNHRRLARPRRSASRPHYTGRSRRRPVARCRGGRFRDRRLRPPRAGQGQGAPVSRALRIGIAWPGLTLRWVPPAY